MFWRIICREQRDEEINPAYRNSLAGPNVCLMCLSYSIFYLRCRFHSTISNDCQDFAILLLRHFNLDRPVDFLSPRTYTVNSVSDIFNPRRTERSAAAKQAWRVSAV